MTTPHVLTNRALNSAQVLPVALAQWMHVLARHRLEIASVKELYNANGKTILRLQTGLQGRDEDGDLSDRTSAEDQETEWTDVALVYLDDDFRCLFIGEADEAELQVEDLRALPAECLARYRAIRGEADEAARRIGSLELFKAATISVAKLVGFAILTAFFLQLFRGA